MDNLTPFTLKLQKFFKTDIQYLAKGGFWLFFGQIITSISTFILLISFINSLPKEIYGSYKYILSVVGLLAVFSLPGIDTALVQSISRGYEGSIISGLKTKIKWSFIGSFITFGLAIYYHLQGNTLFSSCFFVTSIFIPFMDPFLIYGSFFSGKKLFKEGTKIEMIRSITSTILLITILYFTKNILIIILGYFIIHTFTRGIITLYIIKKHVFNKKEDDEILKYGKKLSLIRLLESFVFQIDKILIYYFLGTTELAIYSVAIAVPEQIKSFFKNTESLILPKISQKKFTELKKPFLIKIYKFSIITTTISVLYIVCAPFLFNLFFPQYTESIIFTQVAALSLITYPFFLTNTVYKSQKMSGYLAKYTITVHTIGLILLFIGISNYGLWGAIIGRLLYKVIASIIALLFFYRAEESIS